MIQTWGIGLVEATNKARDIYRKIGRVPCPFFNNEPVSFTSRRFKHIFRDKNKKLRAKSQQMIRLRLLEHAEAIIKNQDGRVVVELREDYEIERLVNRYGKKVLEKRKARSWGFITEIDGSKVKLVIGQLEDGAKEFLSIMVDDFELHAEDIAKNPSS